MRNDPVKHCTTYRTEGCSHVDGILCPCEDMPRKTLWMTVGLPRSGKTTSARGMKMPIVNPDSIRIALHGQRFIGEAEPMVWAMAKYMVVALFEAGHDDVVLDATNTTVKRRDEWADKRWRRMFVLMPADETECLARAAKLQDSYIVPIIEKMAAQFDPVHASEIRKWELPCPATSVQTISGR
jgi:predicted kinase